MEVRFNCIGEKIIVYLVYRQPGHISNDFLIEFWSLLTESQLSNGNELYLGDYSIRSNQQNNSDANKFRGILNKFRLISYVNQAPHKAGYTLELITDSITTHNRKC